MQYVSVFPKQLLNSECVSDSLKFIQVHLEPFKYCLTSKGMNCLLILFIQYNFVKQ